ncbi:hypothetical protein MASR2M39_00250 [Ignavibacteriales bacterium]
MLKIHKYLFQSKLLLPLYIIFLFTSVVTVAQNKEFRGVKLTDVDSQVLYSEKAISEAMDLLESLNINAVIPVVWNAGYTQYQSKLLDSLFGFSIDPVFFSRDPLETVVIEAHRVGIEVYPWFEYGFSSYYSGGTPPYGGHILQSFPEWAARSLNGDICVKNGFDWMSGVNPDVQNFIIGLTTEVVRNYDIDGIEYSDRMPALPVECGYDSVTVELYKQDHGGQIPPANFYDADWKRWRADKLNDFYGRVRDSVKTLDENLFVASSPSVYPWAYDQYLQDSKTWVNSGIVDQFLPQLYRYSIADYIYELNSSLSHIDPQKKDITFAGVLMNVGSYTIEPQFLLQSLQANRNAGVRGEGFFFYEGLRRNNFRLADTLRSTLYNQPVAMPGREFNRRPKGLLVSEDSTNVVKSGAWETLPVPGFRGGIIRTGSANPASLDYSFDIPADGFYNLYTYLIPGFSFAPDVKYTIKTIHGDTVISVNQQSPGKQGWYHLGTYELSKGKKTVFTLNNEGIPAGKYVMSDAGLLLIDRKRSPDVVVTAQKENLVSSVPTRFKVSNNFPNPFNPETMVAFTLPEASWVNIIIYNQLGELIECISLGELAAGNHQFRWNAKGFPSGPYFIKVESGVNSAVIKTLLLK